jgi:hypothetical protein
MNYKQIIITYEWKTSIGANKLEARIGASSPVSRNEGPVQVDLGGAPVGAAIGVFVGAAVVSDPLVDEGEHTGDAIQSLARTKTNKMSLL